MRTERLSDRFVPKYFEGWTVVDTLEEKPC